MQVGEFRFQKRPTGDRLQVTGVNIKYFDGQFFVNLDVWDVGDDPGIHDFRASDAYAAGGRLEWELVDRPKK
jgi:hypothetical protein